MSAGFRAADLADSGVLLPPRTDRSRRTLAAVDADPVALWPFILDGLRLGVVPLLVAVLLAGVRLPGLVEDAPADGGFLGVADMVVFYGVVVSHASCHCRA